MITGKLELRKYRNLDVIYLDDKCICKMAFTEYAQELVKRWNCYKDLKKQIKRLKQELSVARRRF